MTTTESLFDSLPVQQDANTRISVDIPPLEPNFFEPPIIGKSLYFSPSALCLFYIRITI